MLRQVLWVIIMLGMAACGGGGAGGGAGVASAPPVDPASLSDPTRIGEGAYALGVSGAADFMVSSSNIRVLTFSNANGLDQRAIEIGEERTDYIFRIGFSGAPQSGAYTFSPWGSEAAENGVYSAALFYLLSPDPARQFTANPQGTLNLTADGDLLTGTFEVTLQNENNSATVTVRGAFHRILNRPLGD